MKRSRLYDIWNLMKQRCTNRNRADFARYGGIGIAVCSEWLVFKNFQDWALCHGYSDNLTIDRIDAKGNYEPSNCRWITTKEQAVNKRSNVMISYNGKTQTISQWAEELGVNYYTLHSRIVKRHWDIERALTTEVKRRE